MIITSPLFSGDYRRVAAFSCAVLRIPRGVSGDRHGGSGAAVLRPRQHPASRLLALPLRMGDGAPPSAQAHGTCCGSRGGRVSYVRRHVEPAGIFIRGGGARTFTLVAGDAAGWEPPPARPRGPCREAPASGSPPAGRGLPAGGPVQARRLHHGPRHRESAGAGRCGGGCPRNVGRDRHGVGGARRRVQGRLSVRSPTARPRRRVKALMAEHGLDARRSWAFSDSVNDLPLLSLVGHPGATNADPEAGRNRTDERLAGAVEQGRRPIGVRRAALYPFALLVRGGPMVHGVGQIRRLCGTGRGYRYSVSTRPGWPPRAGTR